jgi:hypothetical protein
MAITFAATITGADATGFTSPVFTASADTPPNSSSKQVALTGLTSGTAAGIRYHLPSDPFTLTFERPAVYKGPVTLSASGVLPSVPRNKHVLRTRKGVIAVVGQNPQTMLIETTVSIPAGAELNDAPNVKAAMSAHGGCFKQYDDNWGDTVINGIL